LSEEQQDAFLKAAAALAKPLSDQEARSSPRFAGYSGRFGGL
jgi:hypothetical protein